MSTFKNAVPLAALLLLGACGKTSGSATAAPAAGAPHAAGDSYELVQVARQEPAGQGLDMVRDVAYALCKIGAQAAHKPVKPFPTPPAGYGETRITTIGNGKSIVIRTETAGGGDSTGMTIENGCEFRIAMQRSVAVKIIHANRITRLGSDDGGPAKVADVSDMPAWPARARPQKSTQEYSEPRTVNGVALRCVPKDYWLKDANRRFDMREMCVYAKDGIVLDDAFEPLIVLSHVRVDLLDSRYAYTVITEPVSMRRIASGEPDPYQVATWLR